MHSSLRHRAAVAFACGILAFGIGGQVVCAQSLTPVPGDSSQSGPYVVKNWRGGVVLDGYENRVFRKLGLGREPQNPTMVKVMGEARVEPGTFLTRLLDDAGKVVDTQTVTVSKAAPAWGTFELGYSIPSDRRGHVYVVELYEENPQTGAQRNRLAIHFLY